ncbi:MAG: hypothetical protein D6796_15865 [Caldilineae bacterium]|nr:MAG: hypothetical protein D6796_15865 [Caldilineae bacterium]
MSLLALMLVAARVARVAAQGNAPLPDLSRAASTAGFLLLLPLGLILLLTAALPRAERDAPQAATTAFVAWGVAVLAYFGAGFALQFGGLAVSNPHPDFAGLYWNWSPLDASFGTGWGFIGLRGWALLGPAATPGVYDLFLRHIALLGVVVAPPVFLLFRQVKGWVLVLFGLLAGTLLYPPVGNWVWSAGWLANLGLNLNQGHGFVDAGIATPFVVAGALCLAARIAFRPASPPAPPPDDGFAEVPMPSAHLPLLGFLGLALVVWSWAFAANVQHIPTAAGIAMPRAALNGFLGAFAGGVLAALYSRFTTGDFNLLMTARGGLSGLVMVSAAAPFLVPWEAVAAGSVAGLLLPLLVYLIDHILKLHDHTAGIAGLGVMGVLGWLAVALLADGSSGAGWNGVGAAVYRGVSGQGVTGLLAASGFVPDWPGQLNAQLTGAAAIVLWTLLLGGVFFRAMAWLSRPRQETAGETITPPAAE